MGIRIKKSPVISYGAAILAFLAALALRILGWPIFDNDSPFLFFIAALALASWYGGFGPGVLATVLGAIAAAVLFLPPITPQGSFDITHSLHLGVYVVTGVFISFLMRQLHRALERSSTAERELENRVRERTAQLAQMNRELESEKNKLRTILGQMQEAVYIVNPQYEVEYANPAMERGFGQVQGQKCYQYLNGPDAGICSHCRNSEVFDGKSFFVEWISPKNQSIYDCFETPIVNQDGIQCKLKIMHDITGLKKAEQELQSHHQQIQQLSSQLLTAQETERVRISKELHDELGQSLTLIKLKIGMLEMRLPESNPSLKKLCHDASTHVDHAIENMRRLSRDLSPVTVETLGITTALRRLTEDFCRTGKIQIAADVDGIDNLLPLQYNIMLFRILQEGLNNIVKHSGASAASFSLKRNEQTISFELSDNGRGFDLETDDRGEMRNTVCLGLTTMGERARTLGGTLTIQSREGIGTRLHFVIPIGERETIHGNLPDNARG